MSADPERSVSAAVDALVARGHSLEAVLAVVQARLAAKTPSSAPDGTSPSTRADGSRLETVIQLEAERDGPSDLTLSLAASPTVPDRTRRVEGLSRYDDLGPIGIGGMGEVRRVRDRRLGRQLALKTLHAPALNRPALVARFLEEAQATAQLEHPGIVPIHDLGELPDGRLWFTMKEVSGQTFGEVIAAVHAVSRTRWETTPSGWNLRRMVDALKQVCEAVGYAHSRGVVHRDLKPANVMVGRHGEVLVLDWGLAKVLGRPDRFTGSGAMEPVETDRSRSAVHRTQVGFVSGTPAYMPPEQAHGAVDRIDARSDVYALGALLYKVLSGRSPYTGNSASVVLEQVRQGPPVALQRHTHPEDSIGLGRLLRPESARPAGPLLPPSLVAACERAMARDPADRFATAAELGAELQAWLDGARRQDEARAVVRRAREKGPEAAVLRERVQALRAEARACLAPVAPWQPEEDKWPGWQLEDAAMAVEQQAARLELEEEFLLRGSLTHAPDLPEAHAALAHRYRAEHAACEAARSDATRAEARLRQHLAALPDEHADRDGHQVYLRGDGALSLVTDPPGAEVLLYRYERQHRRRVPQFVRSLGTTPLRETTLPMGSYLCVLRHPERAEVRYPVSIGRGEHWHGVPPDGRAPLAVYLPRTDELGPDDCYVPAGWFESGSDRSQKRGLPRRKRWVDAQVFRRFPVTNRQFILFLNALVAAGRTEDALLYAPCERAGTVGERGAPIYGFDGRHFALRPDVDGDLWDPDWPVCMVDWFSARAHAQWEAARTGHPWQLPGELAWEKAARGVDGRRYPWGDAFDPSWACMRESQAGRALPAVVDAFPVDESPYGVRHMAGNMQDWCADRFAPDGPPLAASGRVAAVDASGAAEVHELRVLRGGGWNFTGAGLRVANRGRDRAGLRFLGIGFRLARPL